LLQEQEERDGNSDLCDIKIKKVRIDARVIKKYKVQSECEWTLV